MEFLSKQIFFKYRLSFYEQQCTTIFIKYKDSSKETFLGGQVPDIVVKMLSGSATTCQMPGFEPQLHFQLQSPADGHPGA